MRDHPQHHKVKQVQKLQAETEQQIWTLRVATAVEVSQDLALVSCTVRKKERTDLYHYRQINRNEDC